MLATTQLVLDLNQDPASIEMEYWGTTGVEIDGTFYFVGNVEARMENFAIWSYDPLANGGTGIATKVGEIPVDRGSADFYDLTALNDKLYFYTESYDDASILWEFIPATGMANPVTDINLKNWQDQLHLTPLDGKLYFSAYDDQYGSELWQLDPADNSWTISLAADINPGTDSSTPTDLYAWNGKLYFAADDGMSGRELYEYDPAEMTARLVADINPNGSSWPYHLTALGDKLYFGADDGSTGYELWQFDPSANNGEGQASLTADVVTAGDLNPGLMTALGDSIYFATDTGFNSELWQYTPAVAGENGGLPRFNRLSAEPHFVWINEITPVGDVLYFAADHETTGKELWRYDPSVDDTPTLVADLNEGEDDSYPGALVAVGDALLFHAETWPNYGLWEFDTTANNGNGAVIHVTDAGGATRSSYPELMTALGGKLYFSAMTPTTGYELWEYTPGPNGSPGTARIVTDIVAAPESSYPYNLTALEGKLYFAADSESTGTELWQYDPTANAGSGEVSLVADVNAGSNSSYPGKPVYLDGKLFFVADDEEATSHIWMLDLTVDGATPISIHADVRWDLELGTLNDELIFTESHNTSGSELWYFNPATMEVPEIAFDIYPGQGSSYPDNFTVLDGKLFFQADDPTGPALWQYEPGPDDQQGNLTLAARLDDVDFWSFNSLIMVDGKFYFSGDDEDDLIHFLQYVPSSDPGVPGSIVPVGDMAFEDSYDWQMVAVGSHIYFSASDDHGNELWEFTPGAGNGEGKFRRVADIYPGHGSSVPQYLTELDGRLYFNASHPIYGEELWVHDASAFSLGDGTRVEIAFSKSTADLGTVDNAGPDSGLFHEWEDATGQLWIHIDEDVPAAPFDLTWEMSSSLPWFLEPQLESSLGTGSLATVVDAETLRTTGTISGLDLSLFAPGDRVLIATFTYPIDVEHHIGVAMGTTGAYPVADAAHGVQLTAAVVLNTGQSLQVEDDVAGQFVPIIYDADDNGGVGLSDFSGFVAHFGRIPSEDDRGAYRFDFDRNGKVGLSDFVLFVRHFGANKMQGRESFDMPGLLGSTQARLAPEHSPNETMLALEGEPISNDRAGFLAGLVWSFSADLPEPWCPEPMEVEVSALTEVQVDQQPAFVQDTDLLLLVAHPRYSAPAVDATFGDEGWEADDDLAWVDDPELVGDLLCDPS